MLKSKWAGVVAGILIVLALVVLMARLNRPDQKLVLDLPEFIGAQLAEQAAMHLADGGEVLLIMPEIPGAEDFYVAAYRRGFIAALDKAAPTAQVVEAGVTADPMALQAGRPILGSDELARLLKEHAQSKAFVSLAGIPEVTRAQASGWSETNPKLILFAPVGGPVRHLIQAGVVHAAIVPRDDPAMTDEEEGEEIDDSIQARFDQDYEVVTSSPST